MVSIFDKAKDKLSGRRTPKDSDDESSGSNLSRNSSISRSLRLKADRDKDKEKKRLSGLRYENKLAVNSKESINLTGSIKSSKEAKLSKDGPKNGKKHLDSKNGTKSSVKPNGKEAVDKPKESKNKEGKKKMSSEQKRASDSKVDDISMDDATVSNPLPNRQETISPKTMPGPAQDSSKSIEAPVPVKAHNPSQALKEGYGTADGRLSGTENGSSSQENPKNPTDSSDPIPVADERQPLLSTSNGPVPASSSYLSSPKLTIGVIIVLIILVAIIYFTYKDLNDVIMQSVAPQLNSISLLALTNEGLKININSSFTISYDNITNIFYQHLYKLGGSALTAVVMKPHLPINVRVNDLESFSVYTAPSLEIKLLNHETTYLNFNSTIEVMDDNMIKLLNELLENDEEMAINIKSHFKTDIATKFLTLKNQPISIDQDLIFNNNLNDLSEGFKLLGSSFNFEDAKDENEADKVLHFKSLIKYNLTYLNNWMQSDRWFNVYLKDCKDQLNQIGNFVIGANDKRKADEDESGESFEGETLNKLSIDGNITKINKDIIECDSVNTLLHLVLNHESSGLYLKTTTIDDSLPRWLNHILTNINIKVPKLGNTFLGNFQLDDMNSSLMWNTLNVTNFNSSLHLDSSNKVFISNQLDIEKAAESPLPFNFTNLKEHLLTPALDGLITGEFVDNKLNSKVEIDIDDLPSMNRLIGQFINNEAMNINDIQLLISTIMLQTPIFAGELKDLSLPKQSFTFKNPQSFKAMVNDNVHIDVADVVVTSSREDTLNLEVLVRITNPMNFTLEVNQAINVDLLSKGEKIGIINIPDLLVVNDEPYMNIINLTINKLAQNHKVLEDFVNQMISNDDTQTINVKFNSPKILEGIQPKEAFKIPQLQFHDKNNKEGDDNDEDGDGKDEKLRQNPFVLDTVIHLVGSTVELEVYNPMSNMEFELYLTGVTASHDNKILAELKESQYITVTPGIHKTPRIPVKFNSVGSKMLQKALNGEMMVNVTSMFTLQIDKFNLNLEYQGNNVTAKIKI